MVGDKPPCPSRRPLVSGVEYAADLRWPKFEEGHGAKQRFDVFLDDLAVALMRLRRGRALMPACHSPFIEEGPKSDFARLNIGASTHGRDKLGRFD